MAQSEERNKMLTIRARNNLLALLAVLMIPALTSWASNPSRLPSPAARSPQVSFRIVITTPPPEIPVYDQPPCPEDDYIWVPGYWAWDDDDEDYYWVPGTWVQAPEQDVLWTPGYWAWSGDHFVFYDGYWGPTIGFYGGV